MSFPENSDAQKRLLVWDRGVLLSKLGGKQDLLCQISQLFLTDSEATIATISKGLIDHKDIELLSRAAHKLKGSAMDISADLLAESALQLELAAKEKKFAGLRC